MSIGNPSTSPNTLSATGNLLAWPSPYPRHFLLLVVLLCLLPAIVVMGYLHYRDHARNTEKILQQQIQLLGELKAQEVARWFRQRRDNARAIKEFLYAAGLQDFMTGPETSPGRQGVITWLRLLQNHFQFSAVTLIDTAGKTLGSVPVAGKVLAPQTRSVAEQTLQSGMVTFTDFYRISSSMADTDTASRLDFVIPLRASPAGDTSLLGVLVLEIDPNRVLFPLLQSWPVSGTTGETILVRQTADQIVYLSPLSHRQDQPLTRRLPLDTPGLVAARPLPANKNGVVEDMDYRGAPVSVVLHAIPGSPWHLVTKMDRAEVEDLLHRRMDHILLSAIFLLLVLASLPWLLWRRQADKISTAANLALERQVQTRTAELKAEIERHRNTAVTLQETENRLELAVEGANLGLWHLIFDPNHPEEIPDQIHGLPRLKAFTGYRDEEFPFSLRAWKQKILPEDREQVEQAMDDHLHWRTPDYASEYRIRHRDGTIRWIHSRGKIQRTENGRPLSWSGIDCDITALKQTETTVTRQQTLLQAILDQAQDGIVVCDREGNFLLVNPAARRQTQFNPEGKPLERAAQAWGKAYYPDGTPIPLREWASVKALQGPRILGQEARMVHDDGRYYDILISAAPLYREDGTLFGSVATFTDMTERKKAEQTLKNLNAELAQRITERTRELEE